MKRNWIYSVETNFHLHPMIQVRGKKRGERKKGGERERERERTKRKEISNEKDKKIHIGMLQNIFNIT